MTTHYAIVDTQPDWPGGGAIYTHADGCVLQWRGAPDPVPGLTVLSESEVIAACEARGWPLPDPDMPLVETPFPPTGNESGGDG